MKKPTSPHLSPNPNKIDINEQQDNKSESFVSMNSQQILDDAEYQDSIEQYQNECQVSVVEQVTNDKQNTERINMRSSQGFSIRKRNIKSIRLQVNNYSISDVKQPKEEQQTQNVDVLDIAEHKSDKISTAQNRDMPIQQQHIISLHSGLQQSTIRIHKLKDYQQQNTKQQSINKLMNQLTNCQNGTQKYKFKFKKGNDRQTQLNNVNQEIIEQKQRYNIQYSLTNKVKNNENTINQFQQQHHNEKSYDQIDQIEKKQLKNASKSQNLEVVNPAIEMNYSFVRTIVDQDQVNILADALMFQQKDNLPIAQDSLFELKAETIEKQRLSIVSRQKMNNIKKQKQQDRSINSFQKEAIQNNFQKPLKQLVKVKQKSFTLSQAQIEQSQSYISIKKNQNQNQNQNQSQKQKQQYIDTSSPDFHRKIPDKIKGSYYQTIILHTKQNEKMSAKQKLVMKDIYSLQLPQLKGKISYYTKDPSKLTQASYIVNYIEFYLIQKCSFMIKNIEKIKVLKNNMGLVQIKISYYAIDMKKQIKMNKKNVDISKEHDQKDNEVIHFVFEANNYEDTFKLFSGIIVRKFLLSNFLVNQPFSSLQKDKLSVIKKIQGQIYKSSRILHFWQKKRVLLNDELRVYNKDKVSFTMKTVSELWTRFDMHNGHFIIKVWSGPQKIGFGIPILNYTNFEHPQNWLFGLYKILAK